MCSCISSLLPSNSRYFSSRCMVVVYMQGWTWIPYVVLCSPTCNVNTYYGMISLHKTTNDKLVRLIFVMVATSITFYKHAYVYNKLIGKHTYSAFQTLIIWTPWLFEFQLSEHLDYPNFKYLNTSIIQISITQNTSTSWISTIWTPQLFKFQLSEHLDYLNTSPRSTHKCVW